MGKTVSKAFGSILEPLTGARQAQRADRRAQQAAERQATLAQNQAADLTLENVAQVEAGGTAEGLQSQRRRRGAGTGSVSGSLGINV